MKPARDWESLIGGKWALWVGSVAVFFAVAFFLAYTWHYLPDAGRLAVGFVIGGLFLASGGYARHKTQGWFSEGLSGAGLGILYLTIWAGAQRYGILSFEIAFFLMAATTALGVTLALLYDAVSLTALATTGGFLTPALLSSTSGGTAGAVPLLTYILILNAGILAVSLFKRWRGIIWLNFVATILLAGGWALTSYTAALRWPVFSFVTFYFLLFVGASCFRSLLRGEQTAPADMLLLFTDAFFYAVVGFGIVQPGLGIYPGLFPLALAAFFGAISVQARILAEANAALQRGSGGLALLFLTITFPIQLEQGWFTIAWSMQAAILLTLGWRTPSVLLRRAAQIVWGLSLVALAFRLLTAEPELRLPFVNERALPLLISVLATGWMAVLAGRQPEREQIDRDDLAFAYGCYTVLGGAWLIAQETHLFLSWRQWPAADSWQAGALFMIACLWSLQALSMFAAGRLLRNVAFRFSAFIVAALATMLPLWAGVALPTAAWPPFWNLRWLSSLVVAPALALLAVMIAREKEQMDLSEIQALRVLPYAAGFVVLWGLTRETYATFHYFHTSFGPHWNRSAQMAISLVWTICGISLLVGGIVRRYQPVRVLGLSLLALTVLKVFGFDLSFLNLPLRILSFGGLGAGLIFISWLYSRYGVGRDSAEATDTR